MGLLLAQMGLHRAGQVLEIPAAQAVMVLLEAGEFIMCKGITNV